MTHGVLEPEVATAPHSTRRAATIRQIAFACRSGPLGKTGGVGAYALGRLPIPIASTVW